MDNFNVYIATNRSTSPALNKRSTQTRPLAVVAFFGGHRVDTPIFAIACSRIAYPTVAEDASFQSQGAVIRVKLSRPTVEARAVK